MKRLRSTRRVDVSLLRSLPASVAVGTIVAFPIPVAPGLMPFLKLSVAGVVAGAIYGSVVPGTKGGQSSVMRGGKAGMCVGIPAFLLSLAVWVGSVNVIEYYAPLFAFLVMIGPFLIVIGMIPGAVGGALGSYVRSHAT